MRRDAWMGDCLELMQRVEDKSVDMILCDLPYGTTACKWDTIIPFEPLWAQYKRIIKDNGAIVLTASQPFTSALVMSNTKMFKYCWVWEKSRASNFMNSKRQPLKFHEDVCVFSFGGITTGSKTNIKYNPQDLIRIDKISKNSKSTGGMAWRDNGRMSMNNSLCKVGAEFLTEFTNYPRSILKVGFDETQKLHPTQKPVALFEYLIRTYTNEGETVMDNCAGSFTTAIAAINTNRGYICMEKDEKYFEIGTKRIAYHLQQIEEAKRQPVQQSLF